MRDGVSQHAPHLHAPKPLVVRGGLGRTFGSLATFLALTLIAGGSYILSETFAHPVDAQAVALIAAAFIIALGLLLLFYLLKPRKSTRDVGRRTRRRLTVNSMNPALQVSAKTAAANASRSDLDCRRLYVDHSRIRH